MKEAPTGIRHRVADRARVLEEAFTENHSAYQYLYVDSLIEHLADVSRTFGGDLQKAVVPGLLGQVAMQALRVASAAGEDLSAIPEDRCAVAASRIADITAIPRETVRRKLVALEGHGWALRTGNGLWRLAFDETGSPAARDLADIDQRALRRVARLVADLETFA